MTIRPLDFWVPLCQKVAYLVSPSRILNFDRSKHVCLWFWCWASSIVILKGPVNQTSTLRMRRVEVHFIEDFQVRTNALKANATSITWLPGGASREQICAETISCFKSLSDCHNPQKLYLPECAGSHPNRALNGIQQTFQIFGIRIISSCRRSQCHGLLSCPFVCLLHSVIHRNS